MPLSSPIPLNGASTTWVISNPHAEQVTLTWVQPSWDNYIKSQNNRAIDVEIINEHFTAFALLYKLCKPDAKANYISMMKPLKLQLQTKSVFWNSLKQTLRVPTD